MSHGFDNLESLLQRDIDNESNIVSNQKMEEIKKSNLSKRQTAYKTANLQDFIQMVSKVTSMALKDKEVEFVPDEGKRIIIDPSEKIDHPYITYKIIDRRPKAELKPRERESLIQEDVYKDKEGRQGRIYGQKFKCIIQFNIIASEYSEADVVMNTFEELILAYTHYFKKNGVAELLFEKHFTDENFDIFRQNISVRSLQYYVEVEKLTVLFDTEIEDINII